MKRQREEQEVLSKRSKRCMDKLTVIREDKLSDDELMQFFNTHFSILKVNPPYTFTNPLSFSEHFNQASQFLFTCTLYDVVSVENQIKSGYPLQASILHAEFCLLLSPSYFGLWKLLDVFILLKEHDKMQNAHEHIQSTQGKRILQHFENETLCCDMLREFAEVTLYLNRERGPWGVLVYFVMNFQLAACELFQHYLSDTCNISVILEMLGEIDDDNIRMEIYKIVLKYIDENIGSEEFNLKLQSIEVQERESRNNNPVLEYNLVETEYSDTPQNFVSQCITMSKFTSELTNNVPSIEMNRIEQLSLWCRAISLSLDKEIIHPVLGEHIKLHLGECLFERADLHKSRSVHTARLEDTKEYDRVLKKILLRSDDGILRSSFESSIREFVVMSCVCPISENLMQLDYAFKDESYLYLVMERMDTDGRQFLYSADTKFSEVLDFLLQLFTAVLQLRDKRIIHRDIKPENVLVKKSREGLMVKLTDFGSSEALFETQYAFSWEGTRPYMAPELMRREAYDQQVDAYSLGVVLGEALTRKRPKDPSEGLNISQKIPIDCFENCRFNEKDFPEEAKSLYSNYRTCTAIDPYERGDIYEVVMELESLLKR